jgi:hypothetical protein
MWDDVISMNRVYFGTLGTKMAYEDEENKDTEPVGKGYDEEFQNSEIGKYFSELPTMREIASDERCACPAFGTTQDPETATKEVQVVSCNPKMSWCEMVLNYKCKDLMFSYDFQYFSCKLEAPTLFKCFWLGWS